MILGQRGSYYEAFWKYVRTMMHAVTIERPVGLSSFFDQAECRLKSEEWAATPVGNTAHMKNDQLKHRPSQWALFLALVVVATLRCADMGMMKSTTSVRTLKCVYFCSWRSFLFRGQSTWVPFLQRPMKQSER